MLIWGIVVGFVLASSVVSAVTIYRRRSATIEDLIGDLKMGHIAVIAPFCDEIECITARDRRIDAIWKYLGGSRSVIEYASNAGRILSICQQVTPGGPEGEKEIEEIQKAAIDLRRLAVVALSKRLLLAIASDSYKAAAIVVAERYWDFTSKAWGLLEKYDPALAQSMEARL